jgi:hypothetical protein
LLEKTQSAFLIQKNVIQSLASNSSGAITSTFFLLTEAFGLLMPNGFIITTTT